MYDASKLSLTSSQNDVISGLEISVSGFECLAFFFFKILCYNMLVRRVNLKEKFGVIILNLVRKEVRNYVLFKFVEADFFVF